MITILLTLEKSFSVTDEVAAMDDAALVNHLTADATALNGARVAIERISGKRCTRVGCEEPGVWIPVLILRDDRHDIKPIHAPSKAVLLCDTHRNEVSDLGPGVILSHPGNMEGIAAQYGSKGRSEPDWSLTELRFAPASEEEGPSPDAS